MKITKSQLKKIIKEELEGGMIKIGSDIELARTPGGAILSIWGAPATSGINNSTEGYGEVDLSEDHAKEMVAALVKIFGESVLPGSSAPPRDYDGVDFLEEY